MIRNYLKIAWRNLLKNKVYSFINIAGLAISLACCMAIGLFVWDELSFDKFQKNGENIFRITGIQIQPDAEYNFATSPGPLAPQLKDEFPEVVDYCRMRKLNRSVVKTGNQQIESEAVFSADNSMFSMFDFELYSGDKKTLLLSPDEIVITEKIAERFFGKDWASKNLLGQNFEVRDREEKLFKLAGIAKNTPVNSHIQFDMLIPVSSELNDTRNYKWNGNGYHTYIQLKSSDNADVFGVKIKDLLPRFVKEAKTKFYLQPFNDIYLHSKFNFNTDWAKTSDILYIKIFSFAAIILIIIALFNFINLTTARAIQRANEVGVRKTIGALPSQLVTQFMGEAALLTGLSLLLGVAILAMILPLLNNIADKHIALPFLDKRFFIILVIMWVAVSLLAGLFPSVYLAKFQPLKALKNSLPADSGQWWRKSFVIAQFASCIALIISTIIIYQQITYVQHKNLGFDKSHLLSIKMKDDLLKDQTAFKTQLRNQTDIAQVSSSSNNLIDVNNGTSSLEWEGKKGEEDKFLMTVANVEPNYITTVGMQIIAGRDFDINLATDSSSAYIINESACKRLGWNTTQAIGKKITLWEHPGQVIGVIKDFHFHKLTDEISPFLLRYWPREGFNTVMVKIQPNKIKEALPAIKNIYRKYNQAEFEYVFVDDAVNNQYLTESRTAKVILYFSILTIFVSCLGLFGLSTFIAGQKIKEIGIRKLLGASMLSIVNLLSGNFVKLVLLAIIIAVPVSYYFMNEWLRNFAYRIEMSWWIFLIAGMLALVIALATVSIQAIKAAIANPVKNLRAE